MGTQGESVAEGEFTISGRDALRKLREHQLESAGAFACHLVAAVVDAGGSYLQFTVTQHGLGFIFDHPKPQQHDLDLLFNAPFNSIAPQWQKELATAINGALGLKPLVLKLETWDHETSRGFSCEMKEDSQNLELMSSPWLTGVQGTRIFIVLRPLNARGFQIARYSKPVRTELSARCSMAPITIRMKGRNQGKGFTFSNKPIAHEIWNCSNATLAHSIADTRETPQSGVWREHHHHEKFTAYLALEARKEPEVTILVNGVAHSLPKDQQPRVPILRAVLAAPHLKKDLSQSKLRNDKQMESLLDWLNQKTDDLILHTCASFWPHRGRNLLFFNRVLHNQFGEERESLPQPVADWYEQCELLEQSENSKKFASVLEEAEQLAEFRQISIRQRLDATQTLCLRAAYLEADWRDVGRALDNLKKLSLPRSFEFEETSASIESLIPGRTAGLVELEEPASANPDFHLRRSLIYFLRGDVERANEHLTEAGAFWRLYLSAHLEDDPGTWKKAFLSALRLQPDANFLLNDLAEACYLREEWREGLEFRISFLDRLPRPRHLWARLRASEASKHGSMAQWVASTVAASMADLSASGLLSESIEYLKELERNTSDKWEALLWSLEKEPLTNGRARFLFHRGFWALKNAGLGEQANKFLYRRILRASISETDVLRPRKIDFKLL